MNAKQQPQKAKKLKSKTQKSRKGTRKSDISLDINAYPTTSVAYAICQEMRLKEKTLAESSYSGVKPHARHIINLMGEIPLAELTTTDIDNLKLEILDRGSKGKVVNGCYTLLRAICKKAHKDRLLPEDLMADVKNMKLADTIPNPFTEEEFKTVIDASSQYKMSHWMTVFGGLTGLRISELICSCWDNVSYSTNENGVEIATILIDLAKPLKNYKVVKTPESERIIELSPEATALLREVEKNTGHLKPVEITVYERDNISTRKDQRKFIFYNEQTGQPWLNPKQFAKQFFTPFLKELGLKHRGPNQLRHTCASIHFNRGSNLAWIADLLGHRDVHIVEKHYAKRSKISLKKEQDKANQTVSSLFNSRDENSIVVPIEIVKAAHSEESIATDDKTFLLNLLQLARTAKSEEDRAQIFKVIDDTLKRGQ